MSALQIPGVVSATSDAWLSESSQTILHEAYFGASAASFLARVWDGAAFVGRPVKYWDGGAWRAVKLKEWNGSAWNEANRPLSKRRHGSLCLERVRRGEPDDDGAARVEAQMTPIRAYVAAGLSLVGERS